MENKPDKDFYWGRCFKCGQQMIQGGDHMGEDYGMVSEDDDGEDVIVSNFHCPNCNSDCLFTWR
jgi:hypothetical protein